MKPIQPVALRDRATPTQIEHHLRAVDAHFVPPLSSRVRLDAYAAKLHARAARFEAWDDTELVGLVAMYCNDESRGVAFISNVSVLKHWRGKGVADLLLKSAIAYAASQHVAFVELAVRRYEALGFESSGDAAERMQMSLRVGQLIGD
jgi:GNAT superfamily N-acetyltransferase